MQNTRKYWRISYAAILLAMRQPCTFRHWKQSVSFSRCKFSNLLILFKLYTSQGLCGLKCQFYGLLYSEWYSVQCAIDNVRTMENEVKHRNQRNRRRERAQRMQAQRESKVRDGDSGDDEPLTWEKPPRPPNRRKKSKEPILEEDIIDGFAIMSFRTYEDLEVCQILPI